MLRAIIATPYANKLLECLPDSAVPIRLGSNAEPLFATAVITRVTQHCSSTDVIVNVKQSIVFLLSLWQSQQEHTSTLSPGPGLLAATRRRPAWHVGRREPCVGQKGGEGMWYVKRRVACNSSVALPASSGTGRKHCCHCQCSAYSTPPLPHSRTPPKLPFPKTAVPARLARSRHTNTPIENKHRYTLLTYPSVHPAISPSPP